jgi:hypothetical protein
MLISEKPTTLSTNAANETGDDGISTLLGLYPPGAPHWFGAGEQPHSGLRVGNPYARNRFSVTLIGMVVGVLGIASVT